MSSVEEPHLHLDVGHILFLDIVGYSTLLSEEQKALVQQLNQIVRETELRQPNISPHFPHIAKCSFSSGGGCSYSPSVIPAFDLFR